MSVISMKSYRGRPKGRGFTMIEMVIALTAAAILVGTVAPFFRVNLKSYMAVRLAKDTLEAARIGFNRMVSEMRRLQETNDINTATSSTFDFFFLKMDGSFVRVKYAYDNTTGQVQRSIGGVNSRLIEGVRSFSFTYFRKDGTSFTPGTLTDIWRVRITTVIGPDSENQFSLFQDIFFKGIGTYY
jgi:prepilin-type N-terminal cleavage/methylation domain-containing protein